jgi:hypothetical protein
VIQQQQLRLSSQKPATGVQARIGRCTQRDEPLICSSADQAKGASPCKVGDLVEIQAQCSNKRDWNSSPFQIGTPIYFASLLLFKFWDCRFNMNVVFWIADIEFFFLGIFPRHGSGELHRTRQAPHAAWRSACVYHLRIFYGIKVEV